MNEDIARIQRLKRRIVSLEEVYMYIGLLTALRVSHDSSDRNLSSSVETYPLNQSQISIFTEEVLKLVREKGQITAWDLYNVATEIYKPGRTDFPALIPQNGGNGGTPAFPSSSRGGNTGCGSGKLNGYRMKYSYYFCRKQTNDISTTRTGVHNRRLSLLYNFNNMTWKKANIIIDGRKMEVPAPDIISASRSTDIPAFYADWFFHRLETGYSVWNNPFNGKKSYISYRNTRFIVFWSKNPKPLLPYLPILKERGIGCYIQFTLNDYEEDGLETGVPPLTERIETFRTLSEILGKEAVIWRFDPLILTDNISVDTLIEKIERVGTEIHNCTEKLVFSFADIDSYRKVKANMTDSGIPYHEWNKEKMEELAGKLTVLNRNRGWNLELATCGENLILANTGYPITAASTVT